MIIRQHGGDPTWQAILRLIERQEITLEELFAGAILELADEVDEDALRAAILGASVAGAERAIPWETFSERLKTGFFRVYRGLIDTAGDLAAEYVRTAMEVPGWTFDADRSRAIRWIQTEGTKQITAIDEASRRAIRETLSRSFRQGGLGGTVGFQDLAKRIKEHIGLDWRQQRAFDRFITELMDSEMSAAQIQRAMDARYKQMIKERSERIAKTESARAGWEGQHMAWEQAQQEGVLPQTTERQWITTPFDICPICIGLDGQRRPLGVPYVSTFNGRSYMRPPMPHPRCKCGERLMIVEAELPEFLDVAA